MSDRKPVGKAGNGTQPVGDLWDTADSTELDLLRESTLEEVIRRGETARDKAQPHTRLSVRELPSGYSLLIRMVARRTRTSAAFVQRASIKHGYSLLETSRSFQTLQQVRTAAIQLAQTEPSGRARRRSELQFPYSFIESKDSHSNISTIAWVAEVVGDIAEDCGFPLYKVAVACSLLSIVTSGENGELISLANRELKNFWDMVYVRTQVLGLPYPD